MNDETALLGRHPTLCEALLHWAEHRPDRPAVQLFGEDERPASSFAELATKALQVATRLHEAGLSGQRVILLYPPGMDFVVALLGCAFARAVAVPAVPPHPAAPERALPRLLSIIEDSGARHVLTSGAYRTAAESTNHFGAGAPLARLRWIATDESAVGAISPHVTRGQRLEDPVFIQYSAGSTGDPKGVLVTHANLAASELLLHQGFESHAGSVAVSWLPAYHDTGPIGTLLHPIYVGFHNVLLSPLDFLKQPVLWLRAISRHRATIAGGPGFTYDLCARRVSETDAAGLDLSSWRVAFNGAEPIRADVLHRFAEKFAPRGFDPGSFYPCYGLAEATLLVSGVRLGRGARVDQVDRLALEQGSVESPSGEAQAIVSAGKPLGESRVKVVDPHTLTPVDAWKVGEIWVGGPSVSSEYFNDPETTERLLRARTADGDGPYLRTGDLGYLSPDGELFVTGRLKDAIVIGGRNLYAEDLEGTLETAHPAIRTGCSAVFTLADEGEEQLAAVVEIERRFSYPARDSSHQGAERRHPDPAPGDTPPFTPVPYPILCAEVRAAISATYGVLLKNVVVVRAGGTPKTSSGKVQRSTCRSRLLAGELPELHRDAPSLSGA